jgi:hypothetical protein
MHVQERRNLARLASEFDNRLRTLCDIFCSTSAPSKPPTPIVHTATATGATAANPSEQDVKQEIKTESAAVDGLSGGCEQPAKRRRRPPAKHEGFCVTDNAAHDAEGLQETPVVVSTGKGGALDGTDKSLKVLPCRTRYLRACNYSCRASRGVKICPRKSRMARFLIFIVVYTELVNVVLSQTCGDVKQVRPTWCR